MLFELYTRLASAFPASCASLFGQPIGESSEMWLAVDRDLYPSLLFRASREDERGDIALRSIDVEFSRECAISSDGKSPLTGVYSIVRLNENDPEIIRVFLRLLEEAFCAPATRFTNREIGDRILELAEIFSRANGTGDLLGLWGELHVISVSTDITEAIRSWCSHKKAKYDFVAEAFALEVKTTVKPLRQHRFSMDQLRPLSGFSVYVASLVLTEAQGGRTVSEVIDAIYATIGDSELRNAFFAQCLRKGGADIYRSSLRLKPFPDNSSLAIYNARDIPVPTVLPSDPIANVRFDVDLSALAALDGEAREKALSFSGPLSRVGSPERASYR